MKIAIVILNWNGKKLLQQFLPSVVEHSDNANVYVADNASTDDSIAYIKETFPLVKIIKNQVNGGYAKGYNDALKGLTEDLFILLNNDVDVTPNWLSPILTVFEKEPKIVAAQPKLLDYKDTSVFEYAGAAGGYLDTLGYPFCRGRIFNELEKDEGQYNDAVSIFWASGACLIVRKEAFWKAGAFDEDLFAHQEEIDLCWRLQSQGGVIQYIPKSVVYHLGGATLATANPKKTFYNFRNTLLVLLKNRAGSRTYVLLFIRMVLDAAAGLQFLLNGKGSHFAAIIKAHASFYQYFFTFQKKRQKWSSKTNYSRVSSIVFSYFLKGKKRFNQL